MHYSFHPLAEVELDGAVKFYESRQPGLGPRFAASFDSALSLILRDPTMWAIFEGPYRLVRVEGFPYCILYSFDSEAPEVIIVAVMHLHRRPGYWKSRLT